MIFVSSKVSIEMIREIFELIPDPRSYHGREYKLPDILCVVTLAIVCNAKTYSDMAVFVKEKLDILKKHLGLKWRQAPTHSCIQKILTRLDPEDFEKAFRVLSQRILEKKQEKNAENLQKTNHSEVVCDIKEQKIDADSDSHIFPDREHLACDGKIMRGSASKTKDRKAQGVLSAIEANQGLIMAHIQIGPDKDHEILAFQELLMSLDLKGKDVSADAIHCQKKTLN